MLYNGLVVNGTYLVLGELGAGGMGVVYCARHLRLDKKVVLKRVKKTGNATRNLLSESFIKNEVNILKRLHHPYLPQVYDIIEYEADLFAVMDYIEGSDLNSYIKKGILFDERTLVRWLRQLGEVLAYLHGQNPPIYHTDIKPANIIVQTNGDICLIDFGISLGENNTIKGMSREYSSPEQFNNFVSIWSGRPEHCLSIDARSDIYSLGATYYHLMTGVTPNVENTALPELSRYALPYSDGLVAIVEKAMSRQPKDRFQSAEKLVKAVDNRHRSDYRYKLYLLYQAAASVFAGFLIIIGVLMIAGGFRGSIAQSYKEEYAEFVRISGSGDAEQALITGSAILENDSYDFLLEDDARGQILHKIGDCFYTNEDYGNAARYYEEAVGYIDSDKYCRDYAYALIRNEEYEKAEEVVRKMRDSSDSASADLVDAQLSYQKRDYTASLETAARCLESAGDSETRYNAYLIMGDNAYATKNYSYAKDCYDQALSIEENVRTLRKTGVSYLAYDNSRSFHDSAAINKAKSCFEKIVNDYSPSEDDVMNLGQCYCLLDRHGECITLLERYISQRGGSFRLYVRLSVVADEINDPRTSEYCEKAHKLYMDLPQSRKNEADNPEITTMRTLYRKYIKSEW